MNKISVLKNMQPAKKINLLLQTSKKFILEKAFNTLKRFKT